jgi:hypothetical protein
MSSIKDTFNEFAVNAASGMAKAAKESGDFSVKVELDIPFEDKMMAGTLASNFATRAEEIIKEGLGELKATTNKIEYRWRITQYLFTAAVVAQIIALFI